MIYSFMIYYNQETQNSIPPNFTPLDNRTPDRNELFEVEPILRFITESTIEDNSFYGFFSPRIFEKTGLSPKDLTLIEEADFSNCDIISISPHHVSGRWFKNPIHQGKWHGGFRWRFDYLVSETQISTYELQDEFIHGTPKQEYFLYSHYFWAKGSFWKRWAEIISKILEKEKTDTIFRAIINDRCLYKEHKHYTYIIFLIERIAGFLAFTNQTRIKEYQLKKRLLHDSKILQRLPRYIAPFGRAIYATEIFALGKYRFPSISHSFLIWLSELWEKLDPALRKLLRK